MDEIKEMQAVFGRGDAVRFEHSPLGGPVAVLAAAGGAMAVVALKGAQVLSYRPPGAADVLWLSPVARLDGSKAVRGGIPVCWPWFGPHPSEPAKPAHGTARTARWRVTATDGHAAGVALSLSLATDAVAAAGLPPGVALTIDVALGDTLAVTLATVNGAGEPITITEALHTYLAVADIADVEIRGLEAAPYIDQLDGHRRKAQSGVIRFDREVDRIYDSAASVRVRDAGGNRTLVIEKTGSASTVVWTPWEAKAARLGDVGDSGWRRFVCVEAANAASASVAIAPGETHAVTTRLSLARSPARTCPQPA